MPKRDPKYWLITFDANISNVIAKEKIVTVVYHLIDPFTPSYQCLAQEVDLKPGQYLDSIIIKNIYQFSGRLDYEHFVNHSDYKPKLLCQK